MRATPDMPAPVRLLLAIVFLAVALASTAVAGDATSGRFMLVAGSIGEGPHQHPTIIKIDTATGETWELIVAEVPGLSRHGTFNGWARIPDDIVAELQRMRSAMPSPSSSPSR